MEYIFTLWGLSSSSVCANFRLRVFVTNHGPDYERDKWGATASALLRLGEYVGCKYAHKIIVIAHIKDSSTSGGS